jgi:basic amino acid/polyamine antiporter, APA family
LTAKKNLFSIIGADIYVASSFGAGFLGPFSLVVWIVAGIIAIVIALCFAQCAMMLPKVGGHMRILQKNQLGENY